MMELKVYKGNNGKQHDWCHFQSGACIGCSFYNTCEIVKGQIKPPTHCEVNSLDPVEEWCREWKEELTEEQRDEIKKRMGDMVEKRMKAK